MFLNCGLNKADWMSTWYIKDPTICSLSSFAFEAHHVRKHTIISKSGKWPNKCDFKTYFKVLNMYLFYTFKAFLFKFLKRNKSSSFKECKKKNQERIHLQSLTPCLCNKSDCHKIWWQKNNKWLMRSRKWKFLQNKRLAYGERQIHNLNCGNKRHSFLGICTKPEWQNFEIQSCHNCIC